MNYVTREIMKLLNVDADRAAVIQDELDCLGIDYSECTDRQLRAAIKEAATLV
jgi:hypothetical protein